MQAVDTFWLIWDLHHYLRAIAKSHLLVVYVYYLPFLVFRAWIIFSVDVIDAIWKVASHLVAAIPFTLYPSASLGPNHSAQAQGTRRGRTALEMHVILLMLPK